MTSTILKTEYCIARDTPSDINEHVELLNILAQEVAHVTEMGVRNGVSTRAFLAADVTLRSYDLVLTNQIRELMELARSDGKDVKYIKANVLDIIIEETDILLIDTWHCYEQMIDELRKHAPSVRKYIICHDTQTYGTSSEELRGQRGSNGLLPAIIHYLIETAGTWQFKIHRTNNNGLTVLERISK